MRRWKVTKLVREGEYLAEVDFELEDDEEGQPGWGPYLSQADTLKLEDVRKALRAGDVREAARQATIYRLMPVSAA